MKKWVVFLQRVMNQKLESVTAHLHDFEYLRPKGTITLSIDRKYNIPIIDIRFDDW